MKQKNTHDISCHYHQSIIQIRACKKAQGGIVKIPSI